MNALQIELFGKPLEAWVLSGAIFFSSLLVARLLSRLLGAALPRITHGTENDGGKQPIRRLSILVTSGIPIGALALATNRLVLDESVSFWMTTLLILTGQIVFLAILVHVVPSLVTLASKKYLAGVAKERLEHLEKQRGYISDARIQIRQLCIILLVLVPLLTLLSRTDAAPLPIWGLPVIVVTVKLGSCYKIMRAAKQSLKENRIAEIVDKEPAKARVPIQKESGDFFTREAVVAFFLNLFRDHLKAPKGSPCEFSRVDEESLGNNHTYMLRVRVANDWRSRRMTIAPVGEESGTKSKCFYVIYDDRLVIKLPSSPIGDLSSYLDILRRDARIVERLTLKECVIPRVSVILRRVHSFPHQADFTPREREERYVRWLEGSPDTQKYLKIGKDFAFFMDFSEYHFLQHIIGYLHGVEEKIYDEILSHGGIIRDLPALERMYGPRHLYVFLEIAKAFSEYESEMAKWVTRYDLSSFVSSYQIRKWFFASLAAGEVVKVGDSLEPEFISHVERLLNRALTTDPETIETYRKVVATSVSERRLAQTRSSMEGLTANLMALLATLGQRGVAMRDLKPDNLLVAGDPEKYPEFLARSDDYKIGLIDVETAVILGRSKLGQIEEPQLGGTPHYATPSHFFGNDVLKCLFDDVPKTLRLQDWHAMVIIIYRVITGEILFEKTAELIPTIVETIEAASGRGEDLCGIGEHVSRIFWSEAVYEFRSKMTKEAKVLKSVHVAIPKAARSMLRRYTLEERRKVVRAMEDCVMSHKISKSEKNREYLLSCSHEESLDLMKQYEQTKGDRISSSPEKARIASLLKELASLKSQLERNTHISRLLVPYSPNISAFTLLEAMFCIVVSHMYKKEWNR
jgi:hypothetical protein